MTDFLTKLFTRLNTFLVRATGGRLGGQLGSQSILLLTTTDRRSGQPRATPLSYYRDRTRYIVIVSNWGKASQPEWLLNLLRQPRAAILLTGLLLFLLPDATSGLWPWQLTPLTAPVDRGWLMVPGVAWIGIARAPRPRAARLPLQSQAIRLSAILASMARALKG